MENKILVNFFTEKEKECLLDKEMTLLDVYYLLEMFEDEDCVLALVINDNQNEPASICVSKDASKLLSNLKTEEKINKIWLGSFRNTKKLFDWMDLMLDDDKLFFTINEN